MACGNVVETTEVEKLSCASNVRFIVMASLLNPELKTFTADARYVEEKKAITRHPCWKELIYLKHSVISSLSFLFSRTRYLSDPNPQIARFFTTGFLSTSLLLKQLTQMFCHLLSLIMVLSGHLTFINNVRQKSIVFSSQIPHRFQWCPSPLLGRQIRDMGSDALNGLLLMD